MLKYHSNYIGFREIPNEIALCINICGCRNNCKGCHSPWLAEDNGTPLTYVEVIKLLRSNEGISCICFMGGDKEPWEINRLAKLIKIDYPKLKTAWYSGKDSYSKEIDLINFDYLKIGSYKEKCGPLNQKTTNQVMYEIKIKNNIVNLENITNKFWK